MMRSLARGWALIALLAVAAPSGAMAAMFINEVQSANSTTIADEDGDHPDWVELYNSGSSAVNLAGCGFSDEAASPYKWVFPSVTVQPGGFLLIFASDKNRTTGPYLHLNFKIKSAGETLLLTSAGGTTLDTVPATIILQDQSYGRKPDGTDSWFFFTAPTPGASNSTTGYLGSLAAPAVSVQRGFYNTSQSVALTSGTSGATIRYTLDGSNPTATSTLYSAPISVTGGTGNAFKATVVRAKCFKSGYVASPTATHTYFIGSNATTKYATIPVVSLATDYANFYDNDIGIYVRGNHNNYEQSGDAWERPLHIEFFEVGGAVGFACDGGVRINGARTRDLPQKSLRLYADHQEGPGSFNYQIFPNSPITDYKRFILRNGGNDNENWTSKFTLFRDGLMQSLVRDFNVDTQNFRPAVVFFDGGFFGIYSVTEREDKCYIANHFPDVDEDNLDMLEQVFQEGIEIDEGDSVHYTSTRNYILANDPGVQSNYDQIKTLMDVEAVALEHLAHIYYANTDWPTNNVRFWRPRTADGKWRWMICDTDWGFGMQNSVNHNTLQYSTCLGSTSGQGSEYGTITIASLLRSREFRDLFINRMADMLNTSLLPANVNAKVTTISTQMSPYVAEHLTKWGSGKTVATWNTNVQGLKDFGSQRPAYIRSQFTSFFHLSGTSTATVNVNNQARGSVTFSSVAVPSGSYPWTGTYFNDTPIPVTAVAAPGYHFTGWSGSITGAQNPATVILEGNISLTANFEAN